MPNRPEQNSDYRDQIDPEDPEQVEENEEDEGDPEVPDRPICPNCGWRNTRPSHTRTLLDTVLRTFSMRPYRCRSCGNRFRVIRRGSHV